LLVASGSTSSSKRRGSAPAMSLSSPRTTAPDLPVLQDSHSRAARRAHGPLDRARWPVSEASTLVGFDGEDVQTSMRRGDGLKRQGPANAKYPRSAQRQSVMPTTTAASQ